MGANDKNLKIIKRIFGGDAGKEKAHFREMFEVLILERETTPNAAQQIEIDARIVKLKAATRLICEELDVEVLEDME